MNDEDLLRQAEKGRLILMSLQELVERYSDKPELYEMLDAWCASGRRKESSKDRETRFNQLVEVFESNEDMFGVDSMTPAQKQTLVRAITVNFLPQLLGGAK